MLLAEAISDRDFYYKKAQSLSSRISALSVAYDKVTERDNSVLIDKLIIEFEEYFKQYHTHKLLIEQIESTSAIKLSDDINVSISAARASKEVYEFKLKCYKYMYNNINNTVGDGLVHCVDHEALYSKINRLEEDIKRLDLRISHALWLVEV